MRQILAFFLVSLYHREGALKRGTKKEANPVAELTYSSPEEFEKELLASDTPTLVDFYADWCPPCKMLAPEIEKLEERYKERMRVIKIDIDKHQDLAQHFNVRSIPTVKFFAYGKEQWTQVGFQKGLVAKKVSQHLKS